MLKLANVTKKFGDFVAVDNINLDIKKGEFFGFLGPNGAGKTTTIKMITGLYTPTSGKIYVGDIDTQKFPVEAKMRIGYVPDEPFLYDKLTGLEYLYFSGGLYKLDKKLLHERIKTIIDQLEIDNWINKFTEEYSRGMRQRVAIASALLHNPELIVIDEPIVGLDPQSAIIVKNILKQKSKEGSTIFMSTHLLSIAEELCDRIAIIKDGRIIFETNSAFLEQLKSQHDGKFEHLFLQITQNKAEDISKSNES